MADRVLIGRKGPLLLDDKVVVYQNTSCCPVVKPINCKEGTQSQVIVIPKPCAKVIFRYNGTCYWADETFAKLDAVPDGYTLVTAAETFEDCDSCYGRCACCDEVSDSIPSCWTAIVSGASVSYGCCAFFPFGTSCSGGMSADGAYCVAAGTPRQAHKRASGPTCQVDVHSTTCASTVGVTGGSGVFVSAGAGMDGQKRILVTVQLGDTCLNPVFYNSNPFIVNSPNNIVDKYCKTHHFPLVYGGGACFDQFSFGPAGGVTIVPCADDCCCPTTCTDCPPRFIATVAGTEFGNDGETYIANSEYEDAPGSEDSCSWGSDPDHSSLSISLFCTVKAVVDEFGVTTYVKVYRVTIYEIDEEENERTTVLEASGEGLCCPPLEGYVKVSGNGNATLTLEEAPT